MKTLNYKPFPTIDSHTLKSWLDEDLVTLVDVREVSEYVGEHLPNALLIPLSKFEPDKIPQEQDKTLVLYCRTGNRSAQAAQKLLTGGFRGVTHLGGGIEDWKKRGLPTIVNTNAPLSLMRQVQIIAGSLIITGTVLGAFVSPWFLIISGFVGGGLLFAGITDTCALAMLLAKLPFNQRLNAR
ncbi:rhodanese-like domain-containing protein [Crocosphaera chwakensis]|uniref:Rhodanese-like protein n=1 Tax=Crocosphaera chwakensis CCY0110 TaxID=391612 RepID=A3IK18_9CHRO|nr:rhodanese-like domain-containing protein [Crocosphaera chwakensis]EAZ93007.1 Rhodanese-like protein [Crocosphaera chwakensis CCY0110]